eukprot:CAMPEP_0115006822 /NCGR_PEP_ID=MMETSP0216-20121206/20745_1 /TAXON_ID=223996 /ORGANISM="Protocruzia adherens, Strain Boccale" /LENGTH=105 /DNA_ID=CAMNT_0002373511 /DNA_START=36 /DNA_END=353 /DNA_ORIENTATION=+
MSNVRFENKHNAGMCYLACEEVFEWFNNSVHFCQKGCDFATGRVNDPEMRLEAERMCATLAGETLENEDPHFDKLTDLRVHAGMHPTTPQNIYRACLAGIRRQKY